MTEMTEWKLLIELNGTWRSFLDLYNHHQYCAADVLFPHILASLYPSCSVLNAASVCCQSPSKKTVSLPCSRSVVPELRFQRVDSCGIAILVLSQFVGTTVFLLFGLGSIQAVTAEAAATSSSSSNIERVLYVRSSPRLPCAAFPSPLTYTPAGHPLV